MRLIGLIVLSYWGGFLCTAGHPLIGMALLFIALWFGVFRGH